MPVIAGIDLSLRATAVVTVPLDWDGDWSRVGSLLVGEPLRRGATLVEQVQRAQRIADRVVGQCIGRDVTEVWIESPAWAARGSAHNLGELHGIVKRELVADGRFGIRDANQSSARKVLCGRIPRGADPKEAVQAVLRAAGAPQSWSADEFDAMVCANYALSEYGAHCFAQVEAA